MEVVVLETWLTKKPHPWSFIIGAAMTLLLMTVGLAYLRDWGGWASSLSANHDLVFNHHQFWRLWSTLFAHADEKHLLSNSFLFFILGSFMVGYFGLWSFPISALLCGGLVNWFVLQTMPNETMLIGMSGVDFWLGGAWLALYFLLERRKSVYQRTVRAIGVGLLLFFPAEAFDPSISYRTHLLGFGFGVLWGVAFFLLRHRKFRSAEKYRLIMDEAS